MRNGANGISVFIVVFLEDANKSTRPTIAPIQMTPNLSFGNIYFGTKQGYPSKNITIVVSLAAGTGMDALTRLYAEKLSEALGKPVIVENKPGAGTTLAASQVAAASKRAGRSAAVSVGPRLGRRERSAGWATS